MYEFSTLGNGLRVLTVPMPHVQSVSLGFFVGVGSRHETDLLAGASHFIEHMLFKGTARRPRPRDIAEAIEGKGGVLDASTSVEMTLYWAKTAGTHLRLALDVLADMLLGAAFDAAEMEKERTVISEEINYSLDAPDSLAQILVNQLQWPDHALGRDVAGTRDSVAALDRQALVGYMTRHYTPGQTLLALAGQVRHAEGVALAEELLAEWVPGCPATYDPAPPDHAGPRLHIEPKETEQAHLAFSFAGLSRSDPDRFALRLLNVILGEGMSSRLFQEVREGLGLAYSVDSYITTLHDAGAVGIYAGVSPDSCADAILAILGQLKRLRQEPVSDDELEKAKQFSRGRLALALEDSFTVASWYARQELLGPAVLTPDEALACQDAVQAADIQRLAQSLFQQEHLNLAVVGPLAARSEELSSAIEL